MLPLLLLLLPAALLFMLLTLGFYPGEQLLEPCPAVRFVLSSVVVSVVSRLPRPPPLVLPRGGRLVAHALAGRGPPCL